jgi:uncharacterized protein (DUF2235 family)
MDGTNNDFESETNLMKLRNKISDRPIDALGTYYVEGVGAKNKFVGMAMGWGIGYRVRSAYQYLIQNYHDGDAIYLFGFSRGAYSARILASVVNYGGLPSQPVSDKKRAKALASHIYRAYKGRMDDKARHKAVDKELRRLGIDALFAPRQIKFMGLWDTVESFGWPDKNENVDGENDRYADELCNVRKAVHAVSLDDDRAWDFTPILLSRSHLVDQCDTTERGPDGKALPKSVAKRLDETVDEVWFAGAHADVGGGYSDGRLNGASMNWMLRHLKEEKLLDSYEQQISKYDDKIHDPQKDFIDGTVYRNVLRHVAEYLKTSPYNGGRMKVHSTVFSRLAALHVEGPRSPVGLPALFPECFDSLGDGRYVFPKKKPDVACRLEKVD